MLSILSPIRFNGRSLLRNTHKIRSILYFSYVEHTLSKTFQRHMPHGFILYCIFRMLSILSPILFHGKRLLRSTPTMHSILYFSYVEHTVTNSFERQMPPQKRPQLEEKQGSLQTCSWLSWIAQRRRSMKSCNSIEKHSESSKSPQLTLPPNCGIAADV